MTTVERLEALADRLEQQAAVIENTGPAHAMVDADNLRKDARAVKAALDVFIAEIGR